MGRTISPDDSGTDARAPRIRTLLLARCRRADGSEPIVRVRNLSAKGICGARGSVIDYADGEVVHLSFAGVAPIAATVSWVEADRVGFAFRNPISLADLAAARGSVIA